MAPRSRNRKATLEPRTGRRCSQELLQTQSGAPLYYEGLVYKPLGWGRWFVRTVNRAQR